MCLTLQPHTVHVEVEWLGTPTKLNTQYGEAERQLVKVADASGEASIGFWRQACRRLQELDVKNGTFLHITGITRTDNGSQNTTSRLVYIRVHSTLCLELLVYLTLVMKWNYRQNSEGDAAITAERELRSKY
jgi:hypothetical protein